MPAHLKIRDRLSDAGPSVVRVIDVRRGVLYPARLPELHRLPPAADAAELVAWFWIPEWHIEPGRASRQQIISYPALNLVVEGPDVVLHGATTRVGFRDLSGQGWAVGAMLRPAAVRVLTDDPAALRDTHAAFDAPELQEAVTEAMAGERPQHRDRAAAVFGEWLADRAGPLTAEAREANRAADLLMADDTILRPEDAAARLGMSVRTLQRLTQRHVGLPPAAMIRRRRLQEAAQRIRERPDVDLATLAASLGYADHAHLTNDFRTVLGFTPSTYRASAGS